MHPFRPISLLSALFAIGGCASGENLASGVGSAPGTTPSPTGASGGTNSLPVGSSSGGAVVARGGGSMFGTVTGGTSGAVAKGGSVGTGGVTYVVTTRAPSCTDMIRNGDETDVDCGGSCTTTCAFGKKCAADADCANSVTCSGSICTTCTNSVLDGDETDVDCGGSCPKCAEGKACKVRTDCATYNCDTATSTCGVSTSCLAVIQPTCACSAKVANASDELGCQKVIDCYLANACGPADACASTNDSVCGSNKMGVDQGKLTAAAAVYACNCK